MIRPTRLAIVAVVAGCSGGGVDPSTVSLIAVSVVSGNTQSTTAGATLPNPLVVKATDPDDKPLAGVTITFEVVSGGGSAESESAVTDQQGTAQVRWTLGTSTVAQHRLIARAVVSATQDQTAAVFTATAVAGPATSITQQAGNGQLGVVSERLGVLPTVLVTDQYGNPVSSLAVTFAPSLGGGSVLGGATTTNASGIASSGFWTLGPAVGPNTLTATATGSGISGNPQTFTATAYEAWVTKAPLASARHSHGAGVLNGILYALGGRAIDNTTLRSLEAYDPATNIWTARAPMLTARWGHGVAVVNGLLYAVGGNPVTPLASMESYDPTTNTWTARASMPTARGSVTTAVVNGILYVAGGATATAVLNTVEAYDPASNTWSTRSAMPTARSGASAGVVGSLVYVVGGAGQTGATTSVEVYDPATNLWSSRAGMPEARVAFGLGVVNGLLYSIAGRTFTGTPSTTVYAYDPVSNSWSLRPGITSIRNSLKVGVIGGVLYAVGGLDGSAALSRLESWRP